MVKAGLKQWKQKARHTWHHKVFLDELVLEENDDSATYQQDDLYTWMVIIMGITYIVPAVQMVLQHQDSLYTSGNQGLCFYNYLCSVPWISGRGILGWKQRAIVMDINHIFSNIGYMLYGIAFLIIVSWKAWENRRLKKKKAEERKRKIEEKLAKKQEDGHRQNKWLRMESNEAVGIPKHFGIYYALGCALIGESILSGCYHVCPTDKNFQFDTTYMYVITILIIVKIYQNRHPDVTANAYKIFYGIALLMLGCVIGIYNRETTSFWVFFTIVYSYFLVNLTMILYYMGKWRRPWQINFKDIFVCTILTLQLTLHFLLRSNQDFILDTK